MDNSDTEARRETDAERDEGVAAVLADEYLTALQRGENPPHEVYLARCPDSARAGLADALLGAEFLHRYPPARRGGTP